MQLEMKKNDGQIVTVVVTVKNPLVKTTIKGKTYTMGALVKLASEGSLSDDELSQNEALKGVSPQKATEMVEEAIRLNSVHLTVSEAVSEAVSED